MCICLRLLCSCRAGNTRNALQRLERFLKNKAVPPTFWYKSVARAVLACWKDREIELIRDHTDLNDRFHLLFVALAYRKRAMPRLWTLLDQDLWCKMANMPVGKDTLNRYAHRFWIEARFRDFKEQGFRLDKTQLQHRKRVEALVMCVCIAYTWILFLGVTLEAQGKRCEVDRSNKPPLSLFEFVLRYWRRLFVRREEFPPQFRLLA